MEQFLDIYQVSKLIDAFELGIFAKQNEIEAVISTNNTLHIAGYISIRIPGGFEDHVRVLGAIMAVFADESSIILRNSFIKMLEYRCSDLPFKIL